MSDRVPTRDMMPGATVPRRVRHLTADGLRWVISEMSAPAFDRRGGTHLLFDAETVMRRVRVFPLDWFELSDVDLYALAADLKAPPSAGEPSGDPGKKGSAQP